jgi:hypothetical protein
LGIVHLDTPFLRRIGALNLDLNEAMGIRPLKLADIAPESKLFGRVEHRVTVMRAGLRSEQGICASREHENAERPACSDLPWS